MERMKYFIKVTEQEIKSKYYLIALSMLLSLLATVGAWLLSDSFRPLGNDKMLLLSISIGIMAVFMASLVSLFTAFRAIHWIQMVANRFAREENEFSNQLDEPLEYIYPSYLRRSVLADLRLIVYTWFIVNSLIAISLLAPASLASSF